MAASLAPDNNGLSDIDYEDFTSDHLDELLWLSPNSTSESNSVSPSHLGGSGSRESLPGGDPNTDSEESRSACTTVRLEDVLPPPPEFYLQMRDLTEESATSRAASPYSMYGSEGEEMLELSDDSVVHSADISSALVVNPSSPALSQSAPSVRSARLQVQGTPIYDTSALLTRSPRCAKSLPEASKTSCRSVTSSTRTQYTATSSSSAKSSQSMQAYNQPSPKSSLSSNKQRKLSIGMSTSSASAKCHDKSRCTKKVSKAPAPYPSASTSNGMKRKRTVYEDCAGSSLGEKSGKSHIGSSKPAQSRSARAPAKRARAAAPAKSPEDDSADIPKPRTISVKGQHKFQCPNPECLQTFRRRSDFPRHWNTSVRCIGDDPTRKCFPYNCPGVDGIPCGFSKVSARNDEVRRHWRKDHEREMLDDHAVQMQKHSTPAASRKTRRHKGRKAT